jgi:Mn2+/Fe2+ NRAMP family transporter
MTDYSNQSYPPAKPNSNMAIASLVLGILGWTVMPGLASIAAIVTGHMAKKEIKESNGQLSGDGMALAGLIMGYASVAIFVCVCLAIAGMMAFGLSIPLLEGNF